jgi:signal transduction histidine kinase
MAAATSSMADGGTLPGIEFPMQGWASVERLVREPVVVLSGAEAERAAALFANDPRLSTLVLAALYGDGILVGFLAVGYAALPAPERDRAIDLLAGIAQHATVALRNARLLEEVRAASELKSEFVGTISHELRSPLNVMLGYLEMALDGELGPLAPDQADVLRRMQRYALTLLDMISSLLDLNRLEAGRLPIQRAPVSIAALLESVRQELPESWCRPEVELRMATAVDLPEVETDAAKLKTVVRNLVHNALKFTEHGLVTIAAQQAAPGQVTITVTDTGRGIPADALEHIFEMFHQLPGTGGGGVGLGLHIVRRFLEMLGGTVRVESEVGAGTRFTITLPCVAGTASEADAA